MVLIGGIMEHRKGGRLHRRLRLFLPAYTLSKRFRDVMREQVKLAFELRFVA